MIVTMIVIVHAHPLTFSNPYETIRCVIPIMIPIMIMKIPNINGIMPRAAMSAASDEFASDETTDQVLPKPTNPSPPTKSAILQWWLIWL